MFRSVVLLALLGFTALSVWADEGTLILPNPVLPGPDDSDSFLQPSNGNDFVPNNLPYQMEPEQGNIDPDNFPDDDVPSNLPRSLEPNLGVEQDYFEGPLVIEPLEGDVYVFPNPSLVQPVQEVVEDVPNNLPYQMDPQQGNVLPPIIAFDNVNTVIVGEDSAITIPEGGSPLKLATNEILSVNVESADETEVPNNLPLTLVPPNEQ